MTTRNAQPSEQPNSLGSIDWLETPELRRWLGTWLVRHAPLIFGKSLRKLAGREWSNAYGSMSDGLAAVARFLPYLTTAEQLMAVSGAVAKCGLNTSREDLLDELHYSLTHGGNAPENRAALDASPWCNDSVLHEQMLEWMGTKLMIKLFPSSSDSEQKRACQQIICQLSAVNISRGPSQAKRESREQLALFLAVRGMLASDDGAKQLAVSLTAFLRAASPQQTQPIKFAGRTHISTPADLFHSNLKAALESQPVDRSKAARAQRRLLHAIVNQDELRLPMFRLVEDAMHRKKGWVHLRNVFTAIFKHVGHKPSDEEQFRDFERANYPWMRNLTPAQYKRLLGEYAHHTDKRTITLTKKERMIVAERYLKLKKPMQFNEGKSSSEVLYGRAMRAVENKMRSS